MRFCDLLKTLSCIVILLFATTNVFAQTETEQQADLDFQNGKYSSALSTYKICLTVEGVLGTKEQKNSLRTKIATCYLLMGKYDEAKKYYEKAGNDKGIQLVEDVKTGKINVEDTNPVSKASTTKLQIPSSADDEIKALFTRAKNGSSEPRIMIAEAYCKGTHGLPVDYDMAESFLKKSEIDFYYWDKPKYQYLIDMIRDHRTEKLDRINRSEMFLHEKSVSYKSYKPRTFDVSDSQKKLISDDFIYRLELGLTNDLEYFLLLNFPYDFSPKRLIFNLSNGEQIVTFPTREMPNALSRVFPCPKELLDIDENTELVSYGFDYQIEVAGNMHSPTYRFNGIPFHQAYRELEQVARKIAAANEELKRKQEEYKQLEVELEKKAASGLAYAKQNLIGHAFYAEASEYMKKTYTSAEAQIFLWAYTEAYSPYLMFEFVDEIHYNFYLIQLPKMNNISRGTILQALESAKQKRQFLYYYKNGAIYDEKDKIQFKSVNGTLVDPEGTFPTLKKAY